MKRKYRFSSRAEAENSYAIQDRELAAYRAVVNDLIRGDYVALKSENKNFTLRLCRATSASGGVAVLTYHPKGYDQSPYTECAYLDDKLLFWQTQSPHTKEQTELRDLYLVAKAYREAAWAKENQSA